MLDFVFQGGGVDYKKYSPLICRPVLLSFSSSAIVNLIFLPPPLAISPGASPQPVRYNSSKSLEKPFLVLLRGHENGAAATTSDVFMSEILKLLCSFGGRILQTPGDGKLRYIGGETHIISIRKHVGLNELKHKTNALCNHLCIRSSISYRQKILMCLYLFDRMRIFFI
ncbi:hypothetical protein YC2023_072473 [Brassica napus]